MRRNDENEELTAEKSAGPLIIRLIVLLALAAAVIVFITCFKLENVEIRPGSHYTEEEIRQKLFTKKTWKQFIHAAFPVQMLAFSTSSSAATLPLTMERTQKHLGVSEEVSSFVLPVGVTINMDGTSCYQAVAAVFLAQVLGLDLTFGQMLLILATATISSIGTPGIPGGSIVMLMIVLDSVGIPIEGLALILGIDRPLDMLRTVVNVTGDMTVASVVDE